MGNQYQQVVQYPAAFGKGVLTVGATTNTDIQADYSSEGPWIDVTAPGGGGFGINNQIQDYIYSTLPGNNYGWTFSDGFGIEGTSFSAPIVTGLSALLLSYNSTLYNDDIEQIIRLSADDVNSSSYPGFDQYLGTGRVNAQKAFQLISAPNQIERLGAYAGGTVTSTSSLFNASLFGVPGISDGFYQVQRVEVIRDVQFSDYYLPPVGAGSFSLPQVWGNSTATPAAQTGLSYYNYSCATCCSPSITIWGLPNTEVVPGTVTNTGCRLRTYVYKVYEVYEYIPDICYQGAFLGYFPASPSNVRFYATVVGYPTYSLNKKGIASVSTDFFMDQNYPNPFNPSTEIIYSLKEDVFVTLKVYDILGRELKTLVNEKKPAGTYSVNFDASNLSSGVYFYSIKAGNFHQTRKMILAE